MCKIESTFYEPTDDGHLLVDLEINIDTKWEDLEVGYLSPDVDDGDE